jgi:NitT/TauT family transport system ATP-binding protein
LESDVTPKLETRGLGVAFAKAGGLPVEALRDVNLAIADGEFVSVVGASGCGKTTLLRAIDGLLAPSAGSIAIDGVPVTGTAGNRAFVFQNDSLLPWNNVLDNVTFGLRLQGESKTERNRIGRRLLDMVGLSGFSAHYPHELSGGMRQRVNIARALAVDPAILLMDEPFAALDSQTRELMQAELLKVWNQAARKTVLFVTHQIDEAVFLSDFVVVLTVRPGRVREIIPVPLPRPRTLAIKRTPEFIALMDRIWELIEDEVRASLLSAP